MSATVTRRQPLIFDGHGYETSATVIRDQSLAYHYIYIFITANIKKNLLVYKGVELKLVREEELFPP